MEIRRFGAGGRLLECERLLGSRLCGREGRLILLPIPTTRDGIYISGGVSIEELCGALLPGDDMVGYDLPVSLRDFAAGIGVRCYDAACDDAFVLANARLSARGALGYLLTHSERDAAELTVGVVGYGRIGAEMCRLLLLLGGRVVVLTRRRELAMELCESGINARIVGEGTELSDLDVLINTAPARQLDPEQIPESVQIIDLASGNIFAESDRVVRLMSLPERYYPLTAGRLYAEGAMSALYGESL